MRKRHCSETSRPLTRRRDLHDEELDQELQGLEVRVLMDQGDLVWQEEHCGQKVVHLQKDLEVLVLFHDREVLLQDLVLQDLEVLVLFHARELLLQLLEDRLGPSFQREVQV
jgi:hypothetical protein